MPIPPALLTTAYHYSITPFSLYLYTAGGKIDGAGDESGGVDASLLVTLDINNTVYQGVLFAKPHSTSSSSPSQR